jgi:hypothetical protein
LTHKSFQDASSLAALWNGCAAALLQNSRVHQYGDQSDHKETDHTGSTAPGHLAID